jgi:hypothetical protein
MLAYLRDVCCGSSAQNHLGSHNTSSLNTSSGSDAWSRPLLLAIDPRQHRGKILRCHRRRDRSSECPQFGSLGCDVGSVFLPKLASHRNVKLVLLGHFTVNSHTGILQQEAGRPGPPRPSALLRSCHLRHPPRNLWPRKGRLASHGCWLCSPLATANGRHAGCMGLVGSLVLFQPGFLSFAEEEAAGAQTFESGVRVAAGTPLQEIHASLNEIMCHCSCC